MKQKSAKKSSTSSKLKKDNTVRKRKAKTDEKSTLFTCSRHKLNSALELIKEKMQAAKAKNPESKIHKCKSIPGRATGLPRVSKFLPCSLTHKCVHLRNALISHNWKEASFLLLNILKDPKEKEFFRSIWKAFFIILQQSPNAEHLRMEQFKVLCCQLSGKDNFLDAVYLQ